MDRSSIWNLPGPSSFLDRIIPDLNGGDGLVLLETPKTFDLDDLISGVLDEDRHLRIARIDSGLVAEEGFNIGLADLFGESRSVPMTIDRIRDHLDGRQMVVCVDSRDVELDGDWAAAVQLSMAARGPDPLGITVLLHVSEDGFSRSLDKVRNRRHRWWGVVSRLDFEVWIALSAPEESPLLRACVAEVAAPDFGLGEELLLLGTLNHDQVQTACQARAAFAGLSTPGTSNNMTGDRPSKGQRKHWFEGSLESLDGQIRVHSGVLSGDRVRRRLWAGQARVMLPKIDSARLELVDRVSKMSLFGPVSEETEIGELSRVIHKSRTPSDIREAAAWLWKARNALSHLDLMDDERYEVGVLAMKKARIPF